MPRTGVDPRDVLEGHYTQADENQAENRTVHGRYTSSKGDPGTDPDSEGTYTNITRTSSERQGKFVRTQPPK